MASNTPTNLFRVLTTHVTRDEFEAVEGLCHSNPLVTRHAICRALLRVGLRETTKNPKLLEEAMLDAQRARKEYLISTD